MLQFGLSFASRHACWPHDGALNQKAPRNKEGKMDMAARAIQLQPVTCPRAKTCVLSVPWGGYLCRALLFYFRAGRPCLSLMSVQ